MILKLDFLEIQLFKRNQHFYIEKEKYIHKMTKKSMFFFITSNSSFPYAGFRAMIEKPFLTVPIRKIIAIPDNPTLNDIIKEINNNVLLLSFFFLLSTTQQ